MEPTGRVWIVLTLAGSGAVLAALFSNPLLLGVPIGVGTWLLAHQVAFVRAAKRIRHADPAFVTQSLADERLQADESTTLRVQVGDENGASLGVEAVLELRIPSALVADAESTRRVLDAETEEFEVPLRAPTVGSFEIENPEIGLSSSYGLFYGTVRVGSGCSLTIDPRITKRSQNGSPESHPEVPDERQDGSSLTGTSGDEHENVDPFRPADLRDRGDRNGAGLFGNAQVQDAEPTDARETHVFVDRRASMSDGPPGETKLDYAREIGLALVTRAAENDEPLRVALVDGEDVSDTVRISGSERYQRARRRLRNLEPESDDWTVGGAGSMSGESGTTPSAASSGVETNGASRHDPLRVRRNAVQRIAPVDRNDAFERTLAPYFETMATYVDRVAKGALFRGVDATISERGTDPWFVVITDDSDPDELLGVARLASVHGTELSLFVFPSAFFIDRSISESDPVTDEYREFQSFVSELNEVNGVEAFAVGPHEQPPVDESRRTRSTRS